MRNKNYKDLEEVVQEKGKFFIVGKHFRDLDKRRIRKMHMKKIGETQYVPITVTKDDIPQILPVLEKLQNENPEYKKANGYYFEPLPPNQTDFEKVSKLRYKLPITFYKINKNPLLDENEISTLKIAGSILTLVLLGNLLGTKMNHYPVREKTQLDSVYNNRRDSINNVFEYKIDSLEKESEKKINVIRNNYNVKLDSLWQDYKDKK